jgi:acyl-CoA synthetase (AMP-forming)/AMP-acid ligase II
MHIGSLLQQSAERYPEHLALVYKDRRWTYGAWYARVRRFAQALADRGVGCGDRVAFFVGTSEYSATTYFAAQLLGAVAVPVNFRLAAGELADILRDSGARALIYGDPLRDKVEKSRELLNGADQLEGPHGRDGVSVFVRSGEGPSGANNSDLLFETLAEKTLDRGELSHIPAEHDLAALVYTSGTTGRPKGVLHTQRNDLAIAMNCVMEYSLTHADTALHVAPLYHVGGMQAYFIPHVMVGGTNIIIERYSPLGTLETIERERVTTLFAVPTQIQEMLHHPEFKRLDTTSLRMITTGGAAISAATMERVQREFCANIYNGYGMTEASLTLLLHPHDALAKLGSCGKPTLISECRIVTNDPGRDVAPNETVSPGEIGELIVRGPQVTRGYWEKPVESARKLRNGWLYTGDLFSRDPDGFYHFHGRADDLIVSGGENIYPREVEEVLYRCPGVQEAAVVGLPDPTWGMAVTAFIVKSDPSLSAEDIDLHCRTRDDLASFKRPRRVVFVDALPLNPSGKVLKRELVAGAREL